MFGEESRIQARWVCRLCARSHLCPQTASAVWFSMDGLVLELLKKTEYNREPSTNELSFSVQRRDTWKDLSTDSRSEQCSSVRSVRSAALSTRLFPPRAPSWWKHNWSAACDLSLPHPARRKRVKSKLLEYRLREASRERSVNESSSNSA